ncbi:MAG TPA: hypothetical protein VG298_09905 [Acidimicrobiales bacterium]|nr:hypothetical protein [Acidimicrobiales bacterium]
MPESWKTVKADEVQPGDTVRTQAGDVVLVSRIDPSFMGRPNMLALIEDTDARWYKRPVTADAEVEVKVGA